MIELPANRWPNQQRAFSGTLDAYNRGIRRLCVTSPTGSGKSFCMHDMIHWARSESKTVGIYTQRRFLFEQLAGTLEKEGIPFGRRASGYKEALLRDVQIIMLQTEHRKSTTGERELHPADVVLVDEYHACQGDTFQAIFDEHVKAGAFLVGYTATPIDIQGIDELLVAGWPSECRAAGALVPPETFAPDEPDLRHIRKYQVGEDLSQEDNRKAIMRPGIFGRVIKAWLKHNPDQKPTILFGPDVKGSLFFAEQFVKAGVPAGHVDGNDIWVNGEWFPSIQENRDLVREMSRTGQIKIVCNRYVCLDSETEILTEDGWKGKDTIRKHDRIANWDDGRVYFAFPRRWIRRSRGASEAMVALETPRRSVRVTEDHELLYRTTTNGPYLKDKASNLVDRCVRLPVSGMAAPFQIVVEQPDMLTNFRRRVTANAFAMRARGYDPESSRRLATERLVSRTHLKYKQPYELTLDECEFIGFWIGDGNKNCLSGGGVEYRIYQAVAQKSIVARIDRLCELIGVDVVRRVYTAKTRVGDTPMVTWSFSRGTGFGPQRRRGLFHLEPYLDKHGTKLLWGLNSQQFDSLLLGYWMADGTCHNDNTTAPESRMSICGERRDLFDLLQGIAVCRGYRASIRSFEQSNPKYKPILHLSLTKAKDHHIGSGTQHKHRLQIEEGQCDEEVWCVESVSGNIVTRRRGSVTVMGNCREGIDFPWIECLCLATVFGALTSFLQAGGRGLRAYPGKSKCIILDHGGNWHRGFGSLAEDRKWELGMTNHRIVGERQDNYREKKEHEPIRCGNCGKVRNGGKTCPYCGFEAHKSSRLVVQVDGTLKPVHGDVHKPRRRKMLKDTADKWTKIYHRAKSRKWSGTFKQAEAIFFYENHYWPPRNLPLMPRDSGDWYRKVAKVPMNSLIQGQALAGVK